MFKVISLLMMTVLISNSAYAQTDARTMISYESNSSVDETADRFEEIAKGKGLNIFARIDHQSNAAAVDLELRPTQVIVFGNPKVGTPLMQCSQSVAIDLPQKVLVHEDTNGQVWLSYNKPSYLKERHAISACDEVITKISAVLAKLAEAATSQ